MFSRALPRIRARVDADLRRNRPQRERVLGAIVCLLELTLCRIGNSEDSKANNSFGLTTLRNRHAAVGGDTIRLAFRGKSGVWNESWVSDRRLARIVKRCCDLPGHELFQYVGDDGH
jgi:DNA topoisomerase I